MRIRLESEPVAITVDLVTRVCELRDAAIGKPVDVLVRSRVVGKAVREDMCGLQEAWVGEVSVGVEES